MKSSTSPRPNKMRHVTLRGLFTKNSSGRQNSQSHILLSVTFYSNCMQMCEDFSLNFGDKGTGCCIMTTHRLTLPFSPENFRPKEQDCRSPPTLLFSLSPIEDKAEGPPFWHNWGDVSRITCNAEHPYRTRFTGCIWITSEALGTMYTHGRWLLKGGDIQ
jgi:hypothetical protein